MTKQYAIGMIIYFTCLIILASVAISVNRQVAATVRPADTSYVTVVIESVDATTCTYFSPSNGVADIVRPKHGDSCPAAIRVYDVK